MCFLKEGKTNQAARCIKSRIMTKVIDYFLSIDTFEQKYVVLKVTLKSLQLKYHVHTIGIDQYKMMQQLIYKLLMLVNYFLRHNIFDTFKKTPIGIGNNNHCNILS